MPLSPSPPAPAPVPDHGGNLDGARRQFPDAPEPWLDLSTGINPWPYPVPAFPPELWHRLPGAALLTALDAAAASAYGVRAADHVVAAPGSQALIQWLPRLRPPGRVALLVPTYGEHLSCWVAAGHEVTPCGDDIKALEAGRWDGVVVVNPNNPDGRRLITNQLLALAEAQGCHGGWLVVDEAFADVAPAASVAGFAGAPGLEGLIVLRSFGKFFGLAGVRLGFALTGPALAARIRGAIGPWPVSGPAAAIACAALTDQPWIAATRQRLAAAAARLDHLLAGRGLCVRGGTALFRLAESDAAVNLWHRLGRAGILVRAFELYPHWLRFGLPPDEAGWQRLDEALS